MSLFDVINTMIHFHLRSCSKFLGIISFIFRRCCNSISLTILIESYILISDVLNHWKTVTWIIRILLMTSQSHEMKWKRSINCKHNLLTLVIHWSFWFTCSGNICSIWHYFRLAESVTDMAVLKQFSDYPY